MLGWIALVYSVVCQVLFAWLRDDYDWRRRTISELGEKGSRYDALVSWGYFFPVALLTGVELVGDWWAGVLDGTGFVLLLFLPLAYLVSVFFPCDPGAPLVGTKRNRVHMVFGGLEYLMTPIGFIYLYQQAWYDTRLVAFVVWAAFVLMMIPALSRFRGVFQRVADFAMIGCFAYINS